MKAISWLRILGLMLCVAAAVTGAFAQADSGSISGTVLDSSKASLKSATVKVTNDRTGEERTVGVADDGVFLVRPLKPSFYTVDVSAQGFAQQQLKSVQVTIGQTAHLDFVLQVSGLSSDVTVEDVAPAINTSNATIGINITQREVTSLPLNGRQLSQLYLQAAGSLNAGTGTFQDIHISGQSVEQNAIRYDGVEGGAIVDASPGNLSGESASPFKLQSSLENVQEFRVESNNYPAEYGTGDGGQITVVTKSGSNAFHGSLYEYLRNDALDAKNTFDLPEKKSMLRMNQFGASLGGPIIKDKAFFFGYYEGYRLHAGINNIEAVPSAAIRALPACVGAEKFPATNCVNAAIRPLLPLFIGAGAVLRQPDTTGSNLDVYQLSGLFKVNEDSAGARLDYRFNDKHSMYARFFYDQGSNVYPEGVTGRIVSIKAVPMNGALALTSMMSSNVVNELKFGFNEARTGIFGSYPIVNGIDLSHIAINATGSVAIAGIAGQGNSAGLAIPGGLIRSNSASNGVGTPYTPYTLSFIDNLSWTTGIHSFKFGAEVRLVRMKTDRIGGTTYSFSNLTDLLNGALSSTDNLVDVNQPSPYNGGLTGPLNLSNQFYIGYIQDEIRLRPNLTLNVGLRYEYYSPLKESRDRYVLFDINTGTLYNKNFCETPFATLSTVCQKKSADFYQSSSGNFGPRIGFAWSPFSNKTGLFGGEHTVLRAGFGIMYGPGQGEDTLQPAESDRIWSTPSGGTYCGLAFDSAAYPAQGTGCTNSPGYLSQSFVDPTKLYNRSARVRAYAPEYTVPERLYQYSVSWQQQWGAGFVSTIAYVGSQGRNLFLRNVANRIVSVRTNTSDGGSIPVRQFDIDCNGVVPAAGTPTSTCTGSANQVLHPYAEIDYKTSGGFDSYNALQTQLVRRFNNGLSLSAAYTFAKSWGNSGGSNESLTASNPYDYNSDIGYNIFDVRHNFNISAMYQLPFARNKGGVEGQVLGGWEVGTIINARSGLPVPVQITRPDVIFKGLPGALVNGVDISNMFFNSKILANTSGVTSSSGCVASTTIGSPAICTQAVINTPGGGNSRNIRRPDLVPGVPVTLPNGYINPAAFAIPQPGVYGNLLRNSVHGPGFWQADLIVAKKFPIRESMNMEFRAEFFNLFNHPNFANPPAQLSNVLPGLPNAAKTAQPGQTYTVAGTAGSFGQIRATVGQTVGIGTNRQIQFAARFNF